MRPIGKLATFVPAMVACVIIGSAGGIAQTRPAAQPVVIAPAPAPVPSSPYNSNLSAQIKPAPAGQMTMMDAWVASYNSNPDLLAQRARLRQVDESVSQAVANWRPTISANANYGRNYINNSIRPTPTDLDNQRAVTLNISQPIYRGGKTTAQTAQSEADVRAEREALADREQIVLLAALTSYTDLLRDRAIVNLRQNNIRVLQQQKEATQARFEVGELTRTDVAQSEARLQRAVSDLQLAIAQEATSRAQFIRNVGTAPGELMLPPLLQEVPRTEDEAVSISDNRAPRNATAQHRVTSAQAGVDVAFADLLPQVSAVGSLSKGWDQSFANDRIFQYSVRVQVTVPIFQTGAEYSRVRAAKQFVGQRTAELDSARRQTIEVMIRSWQSLQAAKARVVSGTSQVQANSIALDGVRQEQQVGSRTIIEVLNAEQELLDSQVQLVTARHDVIVAHYTVLAEMGQMTARSLGLPVEYYDEEKNYNDVRNRWIGLGD